MDASTRSPAQAPAPQTADRFRFAPHAAGRAPSGSWLSFVRRAGQCPRRRRAAAGQRAHAGPGLAVHCAIRPGSGPGASLIRGVGCGGDPRADRD